MTTTRRLSLTLLVVAPLIVAQEKPESSLGSHEDIEPLPLVVSPVERIDMEDESNWRVPDDIIDVNPAWFRRRRSFDMPGEDMETAEQVLFRPIFRHRQIVEERQQRRRVKDQRQQELQRRYHQTHVAAHTVQHVLPAQASAQRYYNQYPYNPIKATAIGPVYRTQRSTYPLPYHLGYQ